MLELKCDRCKMFTKEVENCELCFRFVCKDCKDEYSGLCLDCTRKLLENPDGYLEMLRQLAIDDDFDILDGEHDEMTDIVAEEELIGAKCRYCGVDVFGEESECEEIDYNLRKYGYVVCPDCGMTLFPEDLVDE